MKRSFLWLPIILCIVIQAILRWALDTSDIPGAAGTESLYKAAIGQTRGDMTATCIAWLQQTLDIDPLAAGSSLSLLAILLAVIGAMLCGYAVCGTLGAFGTGLLASCWTMTHYYGMLIGADSFAFGCAWFAVGLCWAGCALGGRGIPLLMGGCVLISFAVSIKELALPAVSLAAMAPIFIRQPRRQTSLWLLGIPLIAYSAYWGYAWLWPDQAHRLGQDHRFSWSTLAHGWERLLELYDRGLPEGKFDQLLVLAVLCSLPWRRQRWRRFLVALAGAVLLCTVAHLLDQRTRPRYLGPSALASVVGLGTSLAVILQHSRKIQRHLPLLAVALGSSLFLIDSWSFFHVWSSKRQDIVGSLPSKLPAAPTLWTRQYTSMSDLTLRDLTLYGGAELSRLVQASGGLATTRLRDERHRSLAALSAIKGQPFVVLDPGNCCAGQPVSKRCAERVLQQLDSAGIQLALPVLIDGVERIYEHEKRWWSLLQEAAGPLQEGDFWLLGESRQGEGALPCQQKAPFRRPQ